MQTTTPNKENNSQGHNSSHRSKRHSKRSKKKKKSLVSILKWMKKNPMKVIAIVCGLVLLYITIMFFLYDDKGKKVKSNSQIIEVKPVLYL